MGEIVDLKRTLPVDDQEMIADLCRFAEGLLTEKQVRKKHRLAESDWERLGSDEGNALVEKVEAEKLRRIRDGSTKREKSQQLVVKAPDVLSGILLDNTANAKHRIDSAKLLNDFSANGPAGVPAADRFQISIVIGDQVLNFDKSIKPDVGPNHIDDTDEWLPVIAAKKEDGGSGEPL